MALLVLRKILQLNTADSLVVVEIRPVNVLFFFFSSRRRHTRFDCDWSSDVCSSDLSRLHPDDRFIEDLEMVELDSLSAVNFAVDIEREFGISIADADAARLKTFRDEIGRASCRERV